MAIRIFWALLSLPPMLPAPQPAGEAGTDFTLSVLIENYLRAYNARNIDSMLNMVTDDVEWVIIAGTGISVENSGKQTLRMVLTGYFDQDPSVHSEIEAVMVTGSLVSVRERIHLQSKDGPGSLMSLSVYQIQGNKIQRIWYFPAQK